MESNCLVPSHAATHGIMERDIKLIIADDHQLVRRGFRALLDELEHITVLGEASNGKEVINLLRNGAKPDIVLLDYEMPQMNGLETAAVIQKEYFGIKTIMLTMLNSRELIQEAVGNGVSGFLFKNASPEELEECIKRVFTGGKYFSGEVTMTLLHPNAVPDQSVISQLTAREIEILKLVAQGLSSSEIGQQLFISPRTADTHRNNILQKLQLNGIAALVQFALKNKLI